MATSEPQPPYRDTNPFRCEVVREHDRARVRAVGELDIATVPILRAQLDSLRDAGFHSFVLDLSTLDFMDSTGLRYILDCDAEARRDGFSISLIRGTRAVQRVFELTDTSAHLKFIDP